MLIASPTPAWQPPQPPTVPHDDDDDDEALQAIIMASLMQTEPSPAVGEADTPMMLSSEAQAKQEAAFASAVKPALVAKPAPLADFAAEGSLSPSVKAAIEDLSGAPHHLMLCRVRGDGHCLFRVVISSLVLSAAWGGRAAIDALFAHLASPLIHRSAAEVCRLIGELLRCEDVLAALNDESEGGKPEELVAALRKCAIDFMRENGERFRHCGAGSCDGAASCAGSVEAGGDAEAGADAEWTHYCDTSECIHCSPDPPADHRDQILPDGFCVVVDVRR